MNKWQSIKLEDAVERLIDYRGKSPPKSPIGTPVISAKVVKAGRIIHPIEQTIDPSYYPIWMTRGLPEIGDVVMTTEGPLGEVAQLDAQTVNFVLAQRVVCMQGKSGVLDNRFFKFLLMSPEQQKILNSYVTGTTVSGISQKALRSVPLNLPPIQKQIAIGELLGALDDKIELNRRMNATLEAMARAIFKDWIVDFGPTRAKMEGRPPYLARGLWSLFPDALDDTTGLPEGWCKRSIYEFSDVVYGAPFASKVFKMDGTGVPLIRIRDLATHEPGISTSEVHSKSHMIKPGDIVVGMDGEFRLHIWKGPNAWLNQRVCHFEPKSGVPKSYLAEALREPLGFFELGKVGTTVIHLGKSDIDTFKLTDPTGSVLSAFADLVEHSVEQAVRNALESRSLAQTRDLLLPKLMSGEIRLRDAEKLAEEAA